MKTTTTTPRRRTLLAGALLLTSLLTACGGEPGELEDEAIDSTSAASTQSYGSDYEAAVSWSITNGLRGRSGNDWRANVSYDGHGFWIHPITTIKTTDLNKVVSGRISHIRNWGLPDEQIDYKVTFVNGAAPKITTTQSGWASVFYGFEFLWAGLPGAVHQLYTGDWKSVVKMIVSEVALQSVPALRFHWSSSGSFKSYMTGYVNLNVNEPGDTLGWADNYLLVENVNNVEWRWSYVGPLAGYQCISFSEPSDPHGWSDNYLCYRGALPYGVQLVTTGVCSYSHVRISEPLDPYGWSNNYLCWWPQ